jgi:GTP cyclohydrolase I
MADSTKAIITQLLNQLDTEPGREGLLDTPKRYARFVEEYFTPKPFNFTTFKNEGYDEMVVQVDIPFYSICEHHIVPFFGTASIAYVPREKIVGLSKLPRTLDHFSRRLQNQERITTQVACFLEENLHPQGVAVVLKARHLCMEMRGVQKTGVSTSTSCLRGVFKTNPATRSEFMRIANP